MVPKIMNDVKKINLNSGIVRHNEEKLGEANKNH